MPDVQLGGPFPPFFSTARSRPSQPCAKGEPFGRASQKGFSEGTVGFSEGTVGFSEGTVGFSQGTVGFSQGTVGFSEGPVGPPPSPLAFSVLSGHLSRAPYHR